MVVARPIAGFVVAASAAALGVAFVAQYVGGLEPCPLCIYQRYPYGAAIALGALALASAGRGPWPAVLVGLAGVAFTGDAAIAFYHVGVEQGWFEGLAACAGESATPTTLEELRAQVLGSAPPRCDVVQWSLLGISLAGYNLMYSAALAVLTFAAAVVLTRRRGA